MKYDILLVTFTSLLLGSIGFAQERALSDLSTVSLKTLDGRAVTLQDFKGTSMILEFFNPDCPFVKRAHARKSFKSLILDAQENGAVWLAINANAVGKQGAGAERNKRARKELNLKYPILLNEDGRLGRLLGATRTPEFFVFDAKGMLVYRGALDSSGGRRMKEKNVDRWLQNALEQHFKNEQVKRPLTKPWGCSIKYN